ncbi:MAG: hypothetical protein HON53_17690 [Planctomycetaceae bacterium]|jgi:hypothetical protein|nr:hypothetical protein [Planctomycetaceae bacterium]MBT6157964.1 hypothetical protein [Planctomycetaceae bacterium]MBT6487399.1 hypothetical protein [Planctomycetaceae bacterium]MBT6496904.1 hypothetical protein [Planctomycetaceae bacterium]
MAKNKQQKKKDRERRVAQKKLATAAKRREQKKTETEKESQKPASERAKLMKEAVPKPNRAPTTNKKSTFTQRRTGG